VKKMISKKPLDLSHTISHVRDNAAGGTVVFFGTVRNKGKKGRVSALEYQVYRAMAERRMREIERVVRERWRVRKVEMAHREGILSVGEVSVVVAVSAEHRAEAFEASRFAIEAIKRSLPLWKREVGSKGRGRWVEGSPIE